VNPPIYEFTVNTAAKPSFSINSAAYNPCKEQSPPTATQLVLEKAALPAATRATARPCPISTQSVRTTVSYNGTVPVQVRIGWCSIAK